MTDSRVLVAFAGCAVIACWDACTRPPIPLAAQTASAPSAAPVVRAIAAHAKGGTDALLAAVPRLDAQTKARLRAIAARGATRGMRRGVFAKIGDSITESGSFLQDIGHGWFDLGPYAALAPTIAFFHHTSVDSANNDSFAHASLAAASGWTSSDALEGSPEPVARELDALRPGTALIMLGTNDVDRATPAALETHLARIVDECIDHGVVPVLSTIPDRLDSPAARDRVPAFNERIERLANARGLPLMDLHAALAALPHHGLGDDGIHPSAYVTSDGDTRACNFAPASLRSGYNVRNLVALLTLDKIRTIVFDDGAPDR
jgi:hypothetical protein